MPDDRRKLTFNNEKRNNKIPEKRHNCKNMKGINKIGDKQLQ